MILQHIMEEMPGMRHYYSQPSEGEGSGILEKTRVKAQPAVPQEDCW